MSGQRRKWYQDLETEFEKIDKKTRKGSDKESEEGADNGTADTSDSDFKLSRRVHCAAPVNGLLGAAILPPVGYMEHILEIVKKQLLNKDELLLAESSTAAIKKKNVIHDTRFESTSQAGSKERSTMDSDSSVTGNESVDDEEEKV